MARPTSKTYISQLSNQTLQSLLNNLDKESYLYYEVALVLNNRENGVLFNLQKDTETFKKMSIRMLCDFYEDLNESSEVRAILNLALMFKNSTAWEVWKNESIDGEFPESPSWYFLKEQARWC